MADRDVENASQEVPEIPEILEKALLFALDEAKGKMDQGAEVIPFTTLVVKDNLFIETHPGEDAEECFNFARHTVEGARGAEAYALCYDGYVGTDSGMLDALIAEGGVPGSDDGYAIGYLYTQEEGCEPIFEVDPVYVGEAPNFMGGLKEASEYADEEIEEKYLEEDEVEDVEE
ncbi:hypothetical protein [Adlercreutzia sp. ZJ242]|uniref:hypothetical protein n=1 Tax=Adlercreutzia sp. ZJ242 TaxID=2709409 RepID=UPI0013ED5BA5|nr:hypothetical protein [Adlercreutzia sp. ZJ242]